MARTLASRVCSSWRRGILPVTLVACAWASAAHASPTFPRAMQDGLEMPCTPGCRLCHRDDSGGPGNVPDGRFGAQLRANTLIATDPSTVLPAFETYEAMAAAAGVIADIDGDGQSDRDELVMGLDPNIAGEESICANEVEYGCFASVAPRDEKRDVSAALACAVAVVLGAGLRRRRGRSVRP